MSRRLLLCLTCILLCSTLGAQQENRDKKFLTNADIVLMVQNHFDDDTLIKIIQVSQSDFDVSGTALVDLKNQGVSPAVLRAMLDSFQVQHTAKTSTSAPQQPASAPVQTIAEPSAASARDENTVGPGTPEQAASNFATRSTAPPAMDSRSTGASASPATANAYPSVGMPATGINAQQLAALQSQMASMGMGGMMANMMRGMGGGSMFSMNYPPEQMPHVFLKLGANQGKQEFTPSMAQIGQSKYKGSIGAGGMALRSLATEGLSFAAMGAGPGGMMAMSAFSMASGFMPGMRPGAPKITYVWGLPGRKSPRELAQTEPLFELNYGEIPGVDPDAYEPAVLKLFETKDNYRLVGATQMKMTAKNMRSGTNPEDGKWISEQRWPSHVNKEERGFYILHVDSPLEPGEYAVVLRPVKGYRANSSGLGGHAQVFYSVWDFSVPGVVPEGNKKKKKK